MDSLILMSSEKAAHPLPGREWGRVLLHHPQYWLVASARGPHPFPSRTRPLSLSAPMVLPLRGGGRVGRRQPYL